MYEPNRCYDMGAGMGMPEAMMGMPNGEGCCVGAGMPMQNGNMSLPGVECPPVYECPQERICHREINHYVPHIQPINTKIVNHHVYHHAMIPSYTCSEENDCCNVYDNGCKF